MVAAIGDALARRRDLTVDELDEAVVARAGGWAGDLVMPAFQTFWPRWRQAASHAAASGGLVFGASRGRKVTYTSPRSWTATLRAGRCRAAPCRSSCAATSPPTGPATPAHLARWLWARPSAGPQAAFAVADVEEVQVDGGEAWVNAGDTSGRRAARPEVLLLPYFDALAVGYRPRSDVTRGGRAERALARRAGRELSRCCSSTGSSVGSGTSAGRVAACT